MKKLEKPNWKLCRDVIENKNSVCKFVSYNGVKFHYVTNKKHYETNKILIEVDDFIESSFDIDRDIEEITFEELDLYILKSFGGFDK